MEQGLTEEVVAGLGDLEDFPFEPRERMALRFAERLAGDHHRLDDQFFEEARGVFTEAEIVELGVVTGLFLGLGRFVAALDLESRDESPGGLA